LFFADIKFQNYGMLLSDLIVSFACLFCYINISKCTEKIESNQLSKYWNLFFVFESISFLFGGISHSLISNYAGVLGLISWYMAIYGILCFALGILFESYPSIKGYYIVLQHVITIICCMITTILNDFSIIIIYCFLYLFIVIVINNQNKIISFKKESSRGILIGTFLYILSCIFFIFDIEFLSLNAGIIAHIIIAIGVVYFGSGCKNTIINCYKEGLETQLEYRQIKHF